MKDWRPAAAPFVEPTVLQEADGGVAIGGRFSAHQLGIPVVQLAQQPIEQGRADSLLLSGRIDRRCAADTAAGGTPTRCASRVRCRRSLRQRCQRHGSTSRILASIGALRRRRVCASMGRIEVIASSISARRSTSPSSTGECVAPRLQQRNAKPRGVRSGAVKLLVTGFEPLRRVAENPSATIVRELSRRAAARPDDYPGCAWRSCRPIRESRARDCELLQTEFPMCCSRSAWRPARRACDSSAPLATATMPRYQITRATGVA